MDVAVIPECYVDTALIETVAPPARRGGQQGYNHQKGCGTVARTMQNKFADRFALGIIDKDKHELDYLKEFTEEIDTGSLILHKHKTKPHYFIQIRPAIERFILENADAAAVSLQTFGLPSEFEQLKRVAKKKASKDAPEFRQLFEAILENNAPGFSLLGRWVSYLKERNYRATIDDLKAL